MPRGEQARQGVPEREGEKNAAGLHPIGDPPGRRNRWIIDERSEESKFLLGIGNMSISHWTSDPFSFRMGPHGN